jgi:homoserine kinase
VPATSANLGPGFDCLGLALDITVDITVMSGGVSVPQDHPLVPMAVSAARAAFRAARQTEPSDLSVKVEGSLPVARGLGASAAARAAGIVAASRLLGDAFEPDALLALGASLEGHADNMAPALRGGLQVVVREKDSIQCLGVSVPEGLSLALFIPDLEMPTQESRKLLPQRLSREDAIANASRTALLVGALSQGKWDLLDAATQDRLHQPARAKLFPALFEIFDAAKRAGAHAAYLSGGGSTVAAFATTDADTIASAMKDAAEERGFTGRSTVTRPNRDGARVLT